MPGDAGRTRASSRAGSTVLPADPVPRTVAVLSPDALPSYRSERAEAPPRPPYSSCPTCGASRPDPRVRSDVASHPPKRSSAVTYGAIDKP